MAVKLYALLALSCVIMSSTAINDEEIDDFLNVCIDSKYHKEKPGPESDRFNKTFHCTPWKNHACCLANTTYSIRDNGALSLYKMHWDQCGKTLSPKCRRYFEIDTCMYECSPYMKPWIVVDPHSKKTRKERFQDVPICSEDCDAWFEACKDDLTCSSNWGDYKTWNWTSGMCKMECKTFKEYFGGPKNFCNKLFNYSWKYTKGKAGEDCMTLWPNGTTNVNKFVARKHARELLTTVTTVTTPTALITLNSSGSKVVGGMLAGISLATLIYTC